MEYSAGNWEADVNAGVANGFTVRAVTWIRSFVVVGSAGLESFVLSVGLS